MAINDEELEKVFQQRSKVSEVREDAVPLDMNENGSDSDEPVFTGRFDLSDPELYNPAREKYKKKKDGTSGYGFVSVYMRGEEQKHLEELAKKYKMSKAAIIRMLLINSK